MTDFNFDPNTMTRAYAQRKALTEEENVRPKARPKGIASKPDDGNTDTSSDEPNFYDKMLDKLLGYFSSEDDANKVLSDKTPDRQDTQTSYEDMFGGLSQETRDAVEQAKQKRMGPADRRDVDVVEKEVITEEAEPKPLLDPKDIAPDLQIMKPEGIEDMPPLPKDATEDGGLMSRDTPTEEGETTTEFPARPPLEGETTADTGAGLMSKTYNELPYSTGIVEGSTKEVLLETQSRLKELGFYGNEVDGVTGTQTRNAIKTFQYKNGLDVTGTADEQTRLKLAESKGLVSQPKPQTTLLSFISKGEGGYGAVNNDNSSGNVPKANQKMMLDGYYSDTYNKPLTEMTVNEIMNAQVGTTGKTTEELLLINPKSVASQKKREFFAVGAYQIVPVTMWKAAEQGAIDANDIFSPKVQDKISMDFLAGSDRLKLQAFLAGDPNVSVDEAALDLAKQWASAPVTKTQSVAIKIKKKDGTLGTGSKKVVAGKSYYDGLGNNSAQHTAAETKAMLLKARDENTL